MEQWRRYARVVLLVAAIAGLPAASSGAASAGDVRASVSASQLTLADTVEFQVTLTGAAASGVVRRQFPDFAGSGFDVIVGPKTERQISIVNARTEATLTYSWTLRPRSVGTFTIGPAQVGLSDGRTLRSNAVTVTVTKVPTAAGMPATFEGETISWAKTGNAQIDRQLERRLFLRPVIDKTEAYVGEQITLQYDLYEAEQLPIVGYGLEPRKDPYTGFMTETLYSPPGGQLQFQSRRVGNQLFKVATIERVALFANKSGPVTIPALVMTADVRVQNVGRRRPSFFDDSFFDDFGFPSMLDGRRLRARMVAGPISVNILPLPTEGRPADFSGTVGDFEMTATFDHDEVPQHKFVALKVRFSGTGHIGAIDPPEIEDVLREVPGLELFKEETETEPSTVDGKSGGAKTFNYVLRPTEAGEIKFPAMEYAIFSPAEKSYKRLKTKELALRVLPAEGVEKPIVTVPAPGVNGAPGVAPPPVTALNSDIEYIQTTRFLHGGIGAKPLYRQPGFLLFQFFPVGLVALSLAVRRRRERLEGDVATARRRAARSVASKRLRGVRKLLSAARGDRFFEELDRALRQFLADQLNESAAGLTADGVARALAGRGVEPDDTGEILALLEMCESVRYANSRPDEGEMRRAFERASEAIDRLARNLK